MKKINEWKDYYYNLEYNLYLFPNGVRLLYCYDPETIETDLHISFKGGSSYESQIKVPNGTAHFLEHSFADNPNQFITDKIEADDYNLGSRQIPYYERNAYTSFYNIWLESHGNYEATEKMLFEQTSRALASNEFIQKFIEKDRKIILSEIRQQRVYEKDAFYQFIKSMYAKSFSQIVPRITGEIDDLKSINTDDLIKYKESVLTTSNCIVCVKSKFKEPNKEIIEAAQKLDNNLIKSKLQLSNHPYKLENKSKYGFFEDTEADSITFEINYTYKIFEEDKADYKRDRLTYLLFKSLNKYFYQVFRRDENLVYSVELVNNSAPPGFLNKGISLTTSIKDFEFILKKIYEIFETEIYKFYKSNLAFNWLENQISHYIFKVNSNPGKNIVFNKSYDLFYGTHIDFDYRIAKREVEKLYTKDVSDFYKSFFQKLIPNFWIESPYPKGEIDVILTKSKLYKKYFK